jgi:hypothetical protein
LNSATSVRNFLRSVSDAAFFTNLVLSRSRFYIMLPNAVPRPFFARNWLSAAASCGLFFRIATAAEDHRANAL